MVADRFHELRKHVTKAKIGIEIGPNYSPIAPKREGYRCLVLDVFDAETLREKAKVDPLVIGKISNIEKVDLIGSSTDIGDLVEKESLGEQVDYIVSSHNFEHIPNPIRFLQGCGKVLKPGGVLSMAVPDRRTCFDYFRPYTTLGAWLEAYFAGRQKPSFTQIFEQNSLHCRYRKNGEYLTSFSLSEDPTDVVPLETLREAFDSWQNQLTRNETGHHDNHCWDTHCWTFTPASFELLISDLAFLGLTQLRMVEISETNGNEFYVHFQLPATDSVIGTIDRDRFYKKRMSLLERINSEASLNSIEVFRLRSELKSALVKVGEQQKENEAALVTISQMKKQLEAAERNADHWRNTSHEHIQRFEELIHGVLASKSWRLTSPLRALAAWLRR